MVTETAVVEGESMLIQKDAFVHCERIRYEGTGKGRTALEGRQGRVELYAVTKHSGEVRP
jgi:hypothetical protein